MNILLIDRHILNVYANWLNLLHRNERFVIFKEEDEGGREMVTTE